jgi:hypothetical protein
MEDEEWCAMDDRARSQICSLYFFSDFCDPLKMEGRSIYMHSWTCTDNCLIR